MGKVKFCIVYTLIKWVYSYINVLHNVYERFARTLASRQFSFTRLGSDLVGLHCFPPRALLFFCRLVPDRARLHFPPPPGGESGLKLHTSLNVGTLLNFYSCGKSFRPKSDTTLIKTVIGSACANL